jgi:hypothetical protein
LNELPDLHGILSHKEPEVEEDIDLRKLHSHFFLEEVHFAQRGQQPMVCSSLPGRAEGADEFLDVE